MIRAGDVPSAVLEKTVITDKRILEGDGEAMADMEITIGIGRGHDDGIGVVDRV